MRLLPWALVWLCMASGARAQDLACETSELRVVLGAVAEPTDDGLVARFTAHLRAALAARGIALCERAEARALGVIHVSIEQPEAEARVHVEIRDALTNKQLERTSDLGSVPPDGRALAIAMAADELLRASWAELVLADARERAARAPAEVLSAVQPAAPRRSGPRVELGLEGSGSFQLERRAFGARVHVAPWLSRAWAVRAALGASFGGARDSRHGRVRADALELELGPVFAPLGVAAPAGFALEAALALARLSFVANANELGEASSFSDWSLLARGRARAWLGGDRLRATLALGVVVPVRPAHASDQGRVVTSTEGIGPEILVGCALLL